ncbi:tyrosine-type recombinase/integrase [Vibrio gallicus]|uniref:tyrosine-type recombinase/integrase n=1 Tax=Vibrio gallicus TaxID=190897 RepID=UPI0021C45893|nr:site-specific integrase [Vibrio gallicus]
MKLTTAKLKSLHGKPVPKKVKHQDGNGLMVLQRESGVLSFIFRYRYNNRQKELVLGQYPVISLGEARDRVYNHKRTLLDGYDPMVERKLAVSRVLDAVTVKDALEYWLDNYAAKNRANHEKHRSQFAKHIYPHLGAIPVERVETRHWVRVFDDISKGTFYKPAPTASGYILQNCKQALRYCSNRQFAESNALINLTIADIGKHQGKGDRVLEWNELKDLWKWCGDIRSNYYYRNLTVLLISFGARTQELRLSNVSEWDLESMVWTVPKTNSKTGVAIKRPIPISLVSLITSLKGSTDSEYLLGELKTPESVAVYGSSLHKKLNQEKWTLHDLRRTFATMLNDMEIEPYVVEQLLGHALGGVMSVYNKSQHLEKKRVALDIWTNRLLTDEDEQINNVVNLR